MQFQSPPSFEPDLKLGRGSCGDFEASISSLIKDTTDRWDLGKVEVGERQTTLSWKICAPLTACRLSHLTQ